MRWWRRVLQGLSEDWMAEGRDLGGGPAGRGDSRLTRNAANSSATRLMGLDRIIRAWQRARSRKRSSLRTHSSARPNNLAAGHTSSDRPPACRVPSICGAASARRIRGSSHRTALRAGGRAAAHRRADAQRADPPPRARTRHTAIHPHHPPGCHHQRRCRTAHPLEGHPRRGCRRQGRCTPRRWRRGRYRAAGHHPARRPSARPSPDQPVRVRSTAGDGRPAADVAAQPPRRCRYRRHRCGPHLRPGP